MIENLLDSFQADPELIKKLKGMTTEELVDYHITSGLEKIKQTNDSIKKLKEEGGRETTVLLLEKLKMLLEDKMDESYLSKSASKLGQYGTMLLANVIADAGIEDEAVVDKLANSAGKLLLHFVTDMHGMNGYGIESDNAGKVAMKITTSTKIEGVRMMLESGNKVAADKLSDLAKDISPEAFKNMKMDVDVPNNKDKTNGVEKEEVKE